MPIGVQYHSLRNTKRLDRCHALILALELTHATDQTTPRPRSTPITGASSLLDAYRHVKANRGAEGIDEVSLKMFDADLSRNLYQLWNRMASGSYFPPPVMQVEIPKKQGGVRLL